MLTLHIGDEGKRERMRRVLGSPWLATVLYTAIAVPAAMLGFMNGWMVAGFLVIHVTVLVPSMRNDKRRRALRVVERDCPACGTEPDSGTMYVRRGVGSFWLCPKHIDEQPDWKRWRIRKIRVPQ